MALDPEQLVSDRGPQNDYYERKTQHNYLYQPLTLLAHVIYNFFETSPVFLGNFEYVLYKLFLLVYITALT